jgi:hypothetical protein
VRRFNDNHEDRDNSGKISIDCRKTANPEVSMPISSVPSFNNSSALIKTDFKLTQLKQARYLVMGAAVASTQMPAFRETESKSSNGRNVFQRAKTQVVIKEDENTHRKQATWTCAGRFAYKPILPEGA